MSNVTNFAAGRTASQKREDSIKGRAKGDAAQSATQGEINSYIKDLKNIAA
jgi:hypothetical protein